MWVRRRSASWYGCRRHHRRDHPRIRRPPMSRMPSMNMSVRAENPLIQGALPSQLDSLDCSVTLGTLRKASLRLVSPRSCINCWVTVVAETGVSSIGSVSLERPEGAV